MFKLRETKNCLSMAWTTENCRCCYFAWSNEKPKWSTFESGRRVVHSSEWSSCHTLDKWWPMKGKSGLSQMFDRERNKICCHYRTRAGHVRLVCSCYSSVYSRTSVEFVIPYFRFVCDTESIYPQLVATLHQLIMANNW